MLDLNAVALRGRHLFLLDILATGLSFVGALAIRFDAPSPLFDRYLADLAWLLILLVPARLTAFLALRMYQRVWRYASIDELLAVVVAVVGSSAIVYPVAFVLTLALADQQFLPRSLPVLESLLAITLSGAWRFSLRVAGIRRHGVDDATREPALVVGGGAAALAIIRELRHGALDHDFQPVGVLADDLSSGQQLMGLPVLGARESLGTVIRDRGIKVVLLATPAASGREMRRLVRDAESAGARCLTVPSLAEIAAGRVSVDALREVAVEDLLRRSPARIDTAAVAAELRGRTVLVTGAGGSIGSELSRQLLSFGPDHLVLLGRGENSIFEALESLPKRHGVRITSVILDIRDTAGLERVLLDVRPAAVFHAAAHKHVTFMEQHPEEAVTTNVLATADFAELCAKVGVERFVHISSDKAVNATSVMGATKRAAELAVTEIARRYAVPYVSVRFGNVLSSRGSVVPTFRRQISEGGPITITHPEASRFFMTIPEAVQLVLQAMILVREPGDTFVLDMGEPVRIADLARDLVSLYGQEVGKDVEIEYIGLRPGEKIHEELFHAYERPGPTEHESVLRVIGGELPPDLRARLARLERPVRDRDRRDLIDALISVVPEFRPAAGTRDKRPV